MSRRWSDRRHPRRVGEGDLGRLRAAPGQRLRPHPARGRRGARRPPQAAGGDRQGHAHLQLHVRGRARGGTGRGRRARAADGPDADPGGGAHDPLDARRRRHRDLGLAQPALRQRHQVLLRRGREARRRHRAGDRGGAGPPVHHRRVRAPGQGGAHPRAVGRYRACRTRCRAASTSHHGSWSTARPAPPTRSPRWCCANSARVDIGVEPTA